MASAIFLSPASHIYSGHRSTIIGRHTLRGDSRLCARKPGSPAGSESNNPVLRVAWYGSELLGIAASFFGPAPPTAPVEGGAEEGGGMELVGRAEVSEAIKGDFQRSYFVTALDSLRLKCSEVYLVNNNIFVGNLTTDAYEDDCEFADPAGSFRGLRRFKRNCSNFGSLLLKSNMKLTKWEDLEDKGIGHWRFSCVMTFPWRPILSATGYTEYYFDAQSGKVCRHVENWNVPKMALLKQIFKPTRWVWDRS